MTNVPSTTENVSKRIPWNKGKIVGANPSKSSPPCLTERTSTRGAATSLMGHFRTHSRLRTCFRRSEDLPYGLHFLKTGSCISGTDSQGLIVYRSRWNLKSSVAAGTNS
jgi:hypothetical protein